MFDWHVRIVGNDWFDPLTRDATIYIYRDAPGGGWHALLRDGTYATVAEGAEPKPEWGVKIPLETIEALAKALQEFQGHASHADTEARVLREWLAVEQGRVNEALKRV